MEWHETPEFQKLRRQWYKKLEKSGFTDIEQTVDAKGTVGGYLLGMSQGDLRRGLYKPETEEYFTRARQFAHSLPSGSLARDVWELHAEGVYQTRIAQQLTRKLKTKVSVNRVRSIIKALEGYMFREIADEADEAAKAAQEAWDE
jgi:hypothetical protein